MRRLIIAALFTAFAGAAHAQAWLDQPGAAGTTVVELGEARIKLPPGEWTKLSEASSVYHAQTIPALESVYAQFDGKRLVAVAYLRGNASASASRRGYLPDGSCFRGDVFLNDSENLYPGQWDCLIVNHTMLTFPQPVSPFWQTAFDAIQSYGDVPRPLPYVELAKASPSRSSFAVLEIMVNPELAGFSSNPKTTWSQSEWHKANATPERVAFLKKLAAWGEAYRPIFRQSWD